MLLPPVSKQGESSAAFVGTPNLRIHLLQSIVISKARASALEIIIVVFGKRLGSSGGDLLLVAGLGLLVQGEFRGLQGGSFNKVEVVVSRKLSSQPQKGLFKVVVRLCRDIVVLKVLLSVERNLLGLDLSVLDLDLVSTQDDRNVLTDASQVTMPVRNILVSDTRSHVEHNDGALSLDVVSITESTEFLAKYKIEY